MVRYQEDRLIAIIYLALYATYLSKTAGACRYQSQSTETWGKTGNGYEIEGLWPYGFQGYTVDENR